MCQTLGFHRESNLKKDSVDSADRKRHVFWNLYMIDKNLSLALGRKANFQDEDIDIAYFSLSTDPRQRPWDLIGHATIRFATTQGEVYDRLYSIKASKSSPEERSRAIEELAAKMVELRNVLVAVRTTLIRGGFC